MAGYIGASASAPIRASEIKSKLIATEGQTILPVTTGYAVGAIHVYMNGVRLVEVTDYTAEDGTNVVLSSPAAVDDEFVFVVHSSYEVPESYTIADIQYHNQIDVAPTGEVTLPSNIDAQSYTLNGEPFTGGAKKNVFWENDTNVTESYTITAGKNAGTFGPVAIDSGVTVTIPSGSVWTIV